MKKYASLETISFAYSILMYKGRITFF